LAYIDNIILRAGCGKLFWSIFSKYAILKKSMFLFKKKPKSYLGIDIGASAIKLVELEKEEQRYKLKNYGIFSLKDYLKESWYQIPSVSRKLTNEELAGIIKKTIKEAKIISNQAYFSLPVYSSFSTLIDFPNLSEKEIEAAIPFEAKKYTAAYFRSNFGLEYY